MARKGVRFECDLFTEASMNVVLKLYEHSGAHDDG